ncbi:class I SAM-dependent methyltransferase [Actibacterium sp. XHP0104]|uniref:class I SAM-dependent methyltransferase n=1 Tax=Actibacterium sp. XHP0104 TaxID=2984335 RepID=UPI0021E7A1C7|nr:class I SAM-dependent methyltransferase [Actibacterium sp. XHP0104]MCV2881618.1 class I SAM-dependent methyltransferase [Actibacterium sp. XHP0104]
MSDDKTIRFYDQQSEAYRKLAEGFENSRLIRLMQDLPAGAHVLDLGCGPGHDSAQLARAGFKVTAMDASREMLREAALCAGVTTRHASFDMLDDVAAFDAVWANFSLLHAPKAEFPAHLAAIHRALRPGGVLVFSLKTGSGEGRDRLDRFYSYYEVEELTGLLEAAGFRVTEIEHGHVTGMAGSEEAFVTVTAHA